jgi:hypothetical protein
MLAGVVLCAGAAHARNLRSGVQTLGLTQQHNLPVLQATVAAPSVTAPKGPVTAHPVTGNMGQLTCRDERVHDRNGHIHFERVCFIQ